LTNDSQQPRRVPVIGIVGGIGSGKSSVARALAEIMPVTIVDADVAGHEVLLEPATKQALRDRFGEAIFTPDGEVDRPALGRIVFGADQESRSAKADLEKIVHPRIGEKIREQIASAQADPAIASVILDAAILLETGWKESCDAVVFVEVPEEIRLQRVMETRGWTAEEFAAREATQLPLEQKQALSDAMIDNSQSVKKAAEQLRQVILSIAGG